MRKLLGGLFLALFIIPLFIAAPFAAQAGENSDNVVWYRLHLGRGVGEKAVTPAELADFIDKEITPRFPDGLTAINTQGQWSSKEYGIIKEQTLVVELYCPDTPAQAAKIEAIGKAYTERFRGAKASLFVTVIKNVATRQYL